MPQDLEEDTLNQEGATLSTEAANELVVEHHGWAESIARSVARSWNMDWKLDGLDGAAMEALIFCSRRFQPARGVPFRGYARKRIHEAATEQARRSKSWAKGLGATSSVERQAREVSAELLNIFPDLRSGHLPYDESGGDGEQRTAIRNMLMGASVLVARSGSESPSAEDIADYKRMVQLLALLEPLHQSLMWHVYWEGASLRNLAVEWETDELNVIREHQVLLEHLQRIMSKGKSAVKPKIRPGLRKVALK